LQLAADLVETTLNSREFRKILNQVQHDSNVTNSSEPLPTQTAGYSH
jgi:hypothetical protein